jgi:NADPH:quinone reductase-like Zn-dependent oxidoreductase
MVEKERPTPKEGEVLVRVHATTITATDCIFRRGDQFFARLFTGLFKPRNTQPGDSLSGVVEAIGSKVDRFSPGDEVYGTTEGGFGAQAEYVCLPEKGTLAPKPRGIDHGEAAAICDGALTALPFLRDTGNLQSGQTVLINGASGGIGTFAIQLARDMGAHVTGVCSGANAELVRSLGADEAIDYTASDFTEEGKPYDLIFDTVGKISFSRCAKVLKPGGVFLEAAFTPMQLPTVLWSSVLGSKKMKIAATGLRPAPERTQDLHFLKDLVEAGRLRSVIDRRYSLEQVVEAARHVDSGRKRGSVVIDLVTGL